MIPAIRIDVAINAWALYSQIRFDSTHRPSNVHVEASQCMGSEGSHDHLAPF